MEIAYLILGFAFGHTFRSFLFEEANLNRKKMKEWKVA